MVHLQQEPCYRREDRAMSL